MGLQTKLRHLDEVSRAWRWYNEISVDAVACCSRRGLLGGRVDGNRRAAQDRLRREGGQRGVQSCLSASKSFLRTVSWRCRCCMSASPAGPIAAAVGGEGTRARVDEGAGAGAGAGASWRAAAMVPKDSGAHAGRYNTVLCSKRPA